MQQKAAVERYGTQTELLHRFSPSAKKYAMLHESEMYTPNRTPTLHSLSAVHGEACAVLFLEAHIAHALDILGLQTVGDRRETIRSLGEVLLSKYPHLQLSEWLLFFVHLETQCDIVGIYSQAKIVRLLDQWIIHRNQMVAKIILQQETDRRNAEPMHGTTLQQYLETLTPEELETSNLKKFIS